MTAATRDPVPATLTTRDLYEHVGDVPLWRVRADPAPGTATERGVLDLRATTARLFELFDGVLVEKGMGYRESFLAATLIHYLNAWVVPRDLGAVAGAVLPGFSLPLALSFVRIAPN